MSSQVGAVVGLLCVAATLVPSLALAVFNSITGLLVFVTALLLIHMAYALFAALLLYLRRAFSLGPTVRIPISAPVGTAPNFLRLFRALSNRVRQPRAGWSSTSSLGRSCLARPAAADDVYSPTSEASSWHRIGRRARQPSRSTNCLRGVAQTHAIERACLFSSSLVQ
jgi:hypothetical protein